VTRAYSHETHVKRSIDVSQWPLIQQLEGLTSCGEPTRHETPRCSGYAFTARSGRKPLCQVSLVGPRRGPERRVPNETSHYVSSGPQEQRPGRADLGRCQQSGTRERVLRGCAAFLAQPLALHVRGTCTSGQSPTVADARAHGSFAGGSPDSAVWYKGCRVLVTAADIGSRCAAAERSVRCRFRGTLA
jgi:hypothetical protein